MTRFKTLQIASIILVLTALPRHARAESAYVRVSQVGYEAGKTPFRAYLMSKGEDANATFAVVNSNGVTVDSGHVGALRGSWGNNKKVSYKIYALDFKASAGNLYTISVLGRVPAVSPRFAV